MVEYFIGTNKPANPRIVIPGLEVIEPRFLVVDVTPIAEGVLLAEGIGQGAGAGEGITPGVIGVFDDDLAGIVGDGHDVALSIIEEKVLGAVEANGHGLAVGVAADGHAVGTIGDVDGYSTEEGIAPVGLGKNHRKEKIRPRRGGVKHIMQFQ